MSGLILDYVGLVGIYLMALVGLPLLIFMAYAMRATHDTLQTRGNNFTTATRHTDTLEHMIGALKGAASSS